MIVEFLALLGSAAAAIFAFLNYKLARRQDARRPELTLKSIELLPLGADPVLEEYVESERERFEETQRERREQERREAQARRERELKEEEQRREREEREERKRRGEIVEKPVDELPPRMKKSLERHVQQANRVLENYYAFQNANSRSITPPPHLFTTPPPAKSEPYEGPFPDALAEIRVKNGGRNTAYEVTTWLTLDKRALEPVEHFAEAGMELISEEQSKVTVEIRAQRDGGRLLPSENDWHRFQIPVVRHRTEGSTVAAYEITSPQGGGDAKSEVGLSLDLPELPPGEHE